MRAQDRSNLIKVGIFISSLSIVLMIMIAAIGKESSIFSPKVTIRARVLNAENLKVGSTVELKGLRIGHVEEINIVGYQEVEILINILADNIQWIKKDSKVAISNAGLVGDKQLEILGGTPEGGDFDPEKDILYSEPSFDFKAMAAKGGSIADKADRVLMKIEEILTHVDSKKLAVTLDGLAHTADNLAKASGPFVHTSQKLERASDKFDAIMMQIQKGPGTAHALIYDDGLYEDVRKLMGGAERNSVIKYFIRESIKKAPPKGE